MQQKTYLFILRLGILTTLVSVFLVFKNLLFPFITSKQLFFNAVIEILTIFWIAFIVKYPEFNPFKQKNKILNYLTIAITAFFSALLISSFLGIDFNLSFWGDVERMLGVFHLLHFFLFYLIAITAFTTWESWMFLLLTSIAFAVLESTQVFNTDRKIYGTIGNTAYVSGYLIFNMFFCFILFFKEKAKSWRWLYLLPILIMFPAFKIQNTSGAWVGLASGFIAFFFLYGVLNKNKKIKIATLSIFLLSFLFVTYNFVIDRDNIFTRNSEFLSKLVREISVNKRTFQTRLISWKAGLQDLPNHPFFGTGHGNYAITFDKYFDPKFYDYTRSETYFDRAHNNIIDIVSTSGFAGLLTYLSIFVVAGYYLIRGVRKKYIKPEEFSIISALLIAYFVQNLAVFDSLVTYIGLMIILAYIIWLVREGENTLIDEVKEKIKHTTRKISDGKGFSNNEIITLTISALILLSITYQYNYKPWQMLIATIEGQKAYAQGDVKGTIEEYKRALSFNTVLDRDSRMSLIRLFVNDADLLEKIYGREGAAEIYDYLIEQAEANVNYNEQDSMTQMVLAQILNTASLFHASANQDKAMFYYDRAIEAINKSIAASPGRIPIYFQKAQIYITHGDKDNAIKTLKESTELSDTYEEGYCHLARTLLYYQEEEDAYKYLDQCIDIGKGNSLSPASLIKSYINHYVENEDWNRVIYLYKRLTGLEQNNAENWSKLSQLYLKIDDKESAINAAEKAKELDPSLAQYADEFIENLK